MSDEKMRITSAGNVACTGSIGCVGVFASGGMRIGSNLGIQNSSPTFRKLYSYKLSPRYYFW